MVKRIIPYVTTVIIIIPFAFICMLSRLTTYILEDVVIAYLDTVEIVKEKWYQWTEESWW